jgi:hypothetical protein
VVSAGLFLREGACVDRTGRRVEASLVEVKEKECHHIHSSRSLLRPYLCPTSSKTLCYFTMSKDSIVRSTHVYKAFRNAVEPTSS